MRIDVNFFKSYLLIFLLVTCSIANPLYVDEKTSFYDILPHAQIYIDKIKTLDLKEIQKKEFTANKEKLLAYGYSPDFSVWVKFTLKNSTDKKIDKIIEYGNAISTHIEFYNPSHEYKKELDGLYTMNPKRKTINPIFKIKLEPHQVKTFYLKASSHATPLIIKLNLWNVDEFYDKEIFHQICLALFFGAMIILVLYNLFIFFFTKDISYLTYVVYLVATIAHHTLYVGVANIYLLTQEKIITSVEYSAIAVVLPIYTLALFSKTFLKTKQYPIWDKILNILIAINTLSIIFFAFIHSYNEIISIFLAALFLYLVFLTAYATYRKNRQAYFILIGWIIVFVAWFLMYLSSIGTFDIYQYFPYVVEVALVLEALLFSIALADKINQLQFQKRESDKELIRHQEHEKAKLEKEVKERTKSLQESLDERELLMKELNHRVKNNMQMIISLLRLQADNEKDKKLIDSLKVAEYRIQAMSHLHEMLYSQENITHIDMSLYIKNMISELSSNFDPNANVHVSLHVKGSLLLKQAVYLGLILNEILTNAYKYAFKEKGEIKIEFTCKDKIACLHVEDNGIGFDEKSIAENSLGLTVIKALSEKQLKGTYMLNSKAGTDWKVEFSI